MLYILFELVARTYIHGLVPDNFVRYGFIGIFLIGVARYLATALPWVFMEIAVTNHRIVYRHGVIARQVEEVAINRIEGVNLNQSIMGRLFKFGSLHIYGIGIDQITLPPISNPLDFRRAIQEAINESQTPDANYDGRK